MAPKSEILNIKDGNSYRKFGLAKNVRLKVESPRHYCTHLMYQQQMKTSSIIFSVVVIFAAIACVESTWLFNRSCNGTNIDSWGTYLSGECESLWGSTGYGICSGSTFTEYDCRGSSGCSNCKIETVVQTGECSKQNVYATCTSGDPDYSAMGSSYATLQIFFNDMNCGGSPNAIVAAPINKCLNNARVTPVDSYRSIYVACSKSGTATLTFFENLDCQSIVQATSMPVNTCTVNQYVRFPAIATCVGI